MSESSVEVEIAADTSELQTALADLRSATLDALDAGPVGRIVRRLNTWLEQHPRLCRALDHLPVLRWRWVVRVAWAWWLVTLGVLVARSI